MRLTFLNHTQNDGGKARAGAQSQTNAHVANYCHAARRARQKRVSELSRHPRLQCRRLPDSTLYLGDSRDKQLDQRPLQEQRQRKCVHGLARQACQRCLNTPSLRVKSPLESQLDPFTRTAVDLTVREKSLLHFYLSDGRRLRLGTSRVPTYCTVLHTASCLMESSKVYVYVQLVNAEAVLCKMTQRQFSNDMYMWQALAYRALNTLLQDGQASHIQKLSGFTQISCLELMLRRPDLQSRHVSMLNQYIQDNGGMSLFLSPSQQPEANLDLAYYLGHFVCAELPIQQLYDLEVIASRFSGAISTIALWHRQMTTRIGFASNNRDRHQCSKHIPMLLQTYLNHLDSIIGGGQGIFFLESGALEFIFNLCMTQAVYNRDQHKSLTFLQRLEHGLETDLEGEKDACRLPPIVALCLMGNIRCRQFPNCREKEVEILQAGMDICRLLPLLSRESRLQLAQSLENCALVAFGRVPLAGGHLNEDEIQEYLWEINAKWHDRQTRSTSRNAVLVDEFMC